MAEAIRKKTGVNPRLIEGGGGVFDVVADGRLIFSKQQTGRFPDHEEVLTKLP